MHVQHSPVFNISYIYHHLLALLYITYVVKLSLVFTLDEKTHDSLHTNTHIPEDGYDLPSEPHVAVSQVEYLVQEEQSDSAMWINNF